MKRSVGRVTFNVLFHILSLSMSVPMKYKSKMLKTKKFVFFSSFQFEKNIMKKILNKSYITSNSQAKTLRAYYDQ